MGGVFDQRGRYRWCRGQGVQELGRVKPRRKGKSENTWGSSFQGAQKKSRVRYGVCKRG